MHFTIFRPVPRAHATDGQRPVIYSFFFPPTENGRDVSGTSAAKVFFGIPLVTAAATIVAWYCCGD